LIPTRQGHRAILRRSFGKKQLRLIYAEGHTEPRRARTGSGPTPPGGGGPKTRGVSANRLGAGVRRGAALLFHLEFVADAEAEEKEENRAEDGLSGSD
jgi:hypothetical protein